MLNNFSIFGPICYISSKFTPIPVCKQHFFEIMKKIITVIAVLLAAAAVSFAQPRAIGVRVTNGAEISYQSAMGTNFAEFDLGWSPNYINLAAVYDIVFSSVDNFNFYAGPGADLFLHNAIDDKDAKSSTQQFGVGIAGQLGMEYQISAIPMNISLDWRPVIRLIGTTGFGWDSIALGLRYRF